MGGVSSGFYLFARYAGVVGAYVGLSHDHLALTLDYLNMSVDDSTHPPDRAPLDFAAAGALLSHLFGGAGDGDSRTNPDEMKGYVLDAVLGRGAGGTVYRAYREGRDQPVAIKILHRPAGVSADSRQAQRAWRELQVLSDLRLPCLPRVLDYGSHPRGLFIVTEFV